MVFFTKYTTSFDLTVVCINVLLSKVHQITVVSLHNYKSITNVQLTSTNTVDLHFVRANTYI